MNVYELTKLIQNFEYGEFAQIDVWYDIKLCERLAKAIIEKWPTCGESQTVTELPDGQAVIHGTEMEEE